MNKPKCLKLVEKYADTFLAHASDNFDCEYWIDHADTQKGILAVLHNCGVISARDRENIRSYWTWVREEEDRKRQERNDARRAALSPEMREREDALERMRESMNEHIMKCVVDTLTQ